MRVDREAFEDDLERFYGVKSTKKSMTKIQEQLNIREKKMRALDEQNLQQSLISHAHAPSNKLTALQRFDKFMHTETN